MLKNIYKYIRILLLRKNTTTIALPRIIDYYFEYKNINLADLQNQFDNDQLDVEHFSNEMLEWAHKKFNIYAITKNSTEDSIVNLIFETYEDMVAFKLELS